VLYVVTPRFAEQAEIVQRRAQHAEVAVFKGAGHALFVDEPARFNRTVERFLAQLPPATP